MSAPASSTWAPVDIGMILAQIAAGTVERTVPQVLTRDDGNAMFYPAKVNGIHGDSGSGKTWTALYATAQAIGVGEAVVYIDMEDSPTDVLTRLISLGASVSDIADRFVYVQPDEAFAEFAAGFLRMIETLSPALVVIDSTGESLTLEGAKPNADEEVAAWFRDVPKRIAKCGPAVLLLDHMPKASDSDLWPIGSQRKRAAIDGAQYLQEIMSPFSREQAGAARLVCAKDRHGTYARGQRVGILHVTPEDDDTVRISLTAPPAATGGTGGFEPTGYMERVSRRLEAADVPMTLNAIAKDNGKRAYVIDAVQALIRSGHIITAPGARNSTQHTLVKPFREQDDREPLKAEFESGIDCQRFQSLNGELGTTHLTDSREPLGTTREPGTDAGEMSPWGGVF